ncbi:MAG: hypothetical protein WAU27_13505, partial [Pseudomonadales bacterium]
MQAVEMEIEGGRIIDAARRIDAGEPSREGSERRQPVRIGAAPDLAHDLQVRADERLYRSEIVRQHGAAFRALEQVL